MGAQSFNSESILYLDKSKEKIIFKNSFGTIYENKIKINYKKNKTEIAINDLANYRVIKNNDTRVNIVLFLFSCFFATLSIFFVENNSWTLTCWGFSLLFLIVTMFYKKNVFSVQFVMSIAKQIVIKLDKKDRKSAIIFIKKLESYRESNPSLMTLT